VFEEEEDGVTRRRTNKSDQTNVEMADRFDVDVDSDGDEPIF
jgi:hypothetical protein